MNGLTLVLLVKGVIVLLGGKAITAKSKQMNANLIRVKMADCAKTSNLRLHANVSLVTLVEIYFF